MSDSVLIVEDPPESLRLLSLLMTTAGHEVRTARNAGCDEYFAKPVDTEELVDRVALAVAQNSSSRRSVQ